MVMFPSCVNVSIDVNDIVHVYIVTNDFSLKSLFILNARIHSFIITDLKSMDIYYAVDYFKTIVIMYNTNRNQNALVKFMLISYVKWIMGALFTRFEFNTFNARIEFVKHFKHILPSTRTY